MSRSPGVPPEDRRRLPGMNPAVTSGLLAGLWVLFAEYVIGLLVALHRSSFSVMPGSTAWVVAATTGGLMYLLVRREAAAIDRRQVVERHRMETERSRLAAAIEQAAEVFMITERDGTIVYVNAAFERVTGYARDDVLGRTPSFLKSGHHKPEFYRLLWARLERGEPWSGHVINRRKDGTVYHAEMVISPIQAADGRIVNYIGLQRDVSRERALEDQLRQAQKMEVVGRLTGGIAHDFKNLLAVVQTNADLLASMLTTAQLDATAMVEDLRRAAERGRTLIDKLLAFSRRQQLSVCPLDLGRLVQDSVATLRRLVPEHIRLSVDIAPDLPRALADSGAVEQILMNLATNAADAMPRGGELRLELTTTTVREADPDRPPWFLPGSYVCLTVADTGDGMDESVRVRIFEPFFTTKPLGVGTGLGMAMVYGLVKLQHGFVDVTSHPGAGTVVWIYFTEAPEAAMSEPISGELPGSADQLDMTGSETILVVEDEPALRAAAKRALTRYGYRVLVAADGEEALQIFRACDEEVDLVLSDITMPNVGGLELYHTLNGGGRSVPFLLASGYGPGGRPPLPDVPFLEKPWTVEQLLTKLRHALDAPARRRGSGPSTAETPAPLG